MGDGFDRRRFVRDVAGITGAVGFGLGGVGCRTQGSSSLAADEPLAYGKGAVDAAAPGSVRRSATDPGNAGNLASYSKAIKKMKATPFPRQIRDEYDQPLDTDWWEAHALIHMNFCSHGSWFFLPWHRAYLHYFERVIRKFSDDPGFALPYWDWSADGKLPPAFWTDAELKHPVPEPNPRNYSPRDIDPDSAVPEQAVGKEVVEGILEINDFISFMSGRSESPREGEGGGTGQLEGVPHNTVHGFIGGDMGIFVSPRDPIFWLHHANIDRLWAEWQARMTAKGRSTLPPPPMPGSPEAKLTSQLWLATKLGVFYDVRLDAKDDFSATDAGSMTVEQVQSIAAMGYGYDTAKALGLKDTTVAAPRPTRSAPTEQRRIELVHTLAIEDATKTVSTKIQRTPALQDVLTKVRDRLGRAEASLPNFRLIAERVIVPLNPRTASVRLYLQHGAEIGAERLQYIGAHGFFGTEHVHSSQDVGSRATVNLIFDLLSPMQMLAKSGFDLAGAEGPIQLVFHVRSEHPFPGHKSFDPIKMRIEYEAFG